MPSLDQEPASAWLKNPPLPTLKRLLLGKPIPSHLAHHERLSRVTGLAVLSSDALSSVAYATDSSSRRWSSAGTRRSAYAMPISLVIAALLAIVAFSYRQTISRLSDGRRRLHRREREPRPERRPDRGRVAADRLHADRVGQHLGRRARPSRRRFRSLDAYRVEMCLGFLAVLTVGNLRGIRESGQIFALPTYFFVVSIFALIAVGAVPLLHGHARAGRLPLPPDPATRSR